MNNEIEYWMKEINVTIERVQIHTLLLVEVEINIRFETKQWLIRQEKNEII